MMRVLKDINVSFTKSTESQHIKIVTSGRKISDNGWRKRQHIKMSKFVCEVSKVCGCCY